MPPTILALDLEGTLISNAVSQIPRPGCFAFLEFCGRTFPRIVLFTAVSEERARAVVATAIRDGDMPAWMATRVEYVSWTGPYKDLRFIPGASPCDVLLVDDNEAYVHPEQRGHWIPVEEYAWPYPSEDRELMDLKTRLSDRLTAEISAEIGEGRGWSER